MSSRPEPIGDARSVAARFNIPVDAMLTEMSRSAEMPPPPAEHADTPLPLSAAAIRAAISESWAARDMLSLDGGDSPELLARSEVVMIDGRRRLRLADAARRELLMRAADSELFTAMLREQAALDAATPSGASGEIEARSIWLRRFLTGSVTDLRASPPAELRWALAARERLEGVALPPSAPSLDEVRRLLERAEVLEPIRIAIGAEGPWDQPPERDRFVGRTKELKALRVFVDEIEAESTMESVQRNVSSFAQHALAPLTGRRAEGARVIVSRGGLGKSALIAKFVLDHALHQRRPFPFAYLDFDRAALQPRDPRRLLLEVARQVGTQFPEVEAELRTLRNAIRGTMNHASSMITEGDPFDAFHALMRARVTHGERALLVVLDTMEIVQTDPKAIAAVVSFVERLSGSQFGELRLVVAGRAPIPELMAESPARKKGKLIELDALSVRDAELMVQRLGESLLGSDHWKPEWSSRLAGTSSHAADRREPLSLRIAVETMRDTAASERDAKALEIDQLGEDASASFVGKLYERRVLEHLGDRRARRIAWPGLVLRRVTVEIIRDLLAEPCGLDPNDAQAAFDSLAGEGWIVSRNGDALRHLPDLRARTLPLMRRFVPPPQPDDTGAVRPPVTFDAINLAAIRYFGERRTRSVEDRAEWIYHRLLRGDAPSTVDPDWDDACVPLLRGAEDDFPRDTPAADYLAARTSRELLPAAVIARLDPAIALVHFLNVGAKGDLADATLDPTLAALPLPRMRAMSPGVEAVRATLLVKCGYWHQVPVPDFSAPGAVWAEHARAAYAYYLARMTSADADRSASLHERIGRAHAPSSLVHVLALARVHESSDFPLIDQRMARLLGTRSASADLGIAMPMLRTAIVFGEESALPAARLWIGLLTERMRANERFAFSGAELEALVAPGEGAERLMATLATKYPGGLDLKAMVAGGGNPARFDDELLVQQVGDALLARCRSGSDDDRRALARFAAARSEDWLVPLAYAVERATQAKMPPAIKDMFERHMPGERSFIQRRILSHPGVPTGTLPVLRRADEASDLLGALHLVSQASPDEDLRYLVSRYEEWRSIVQRLVEGARDTA